jgi:hypothetical protein
VTAGVVEILALEQHAHAEFFGEPMTFGQRGWSTGIIGEQAIEFVPETGVSPGTAEGSFEFETGRNKRLGDIASAELAETT